MSPRTPIPRPRPTPAAKSPVKTEDIDPRWILKALLLVVLAALLCGYLTLCLLFYSGQWQIVLHPNRTSEHPSSISGVPVQFLSFAPDESATPQLTAWSISAAPSGRYAATTLLYLPAGDGSLADATQTLSALHGLGINIFAIDYRSYGQSAALLHPSQKTLTEDAESALQYLHTIRSIPEQQIVLYGTGVGASLATSLATAHPQIPAVILESPHADLLDFALRDDRTRLIPARLLFKERFPLAAPLSSLPLPKLLLSNQNTSPAFQTASEPRISVTFNAASGGLSNDPAFLPSLTRFLDQYLKPLRQQDQPPRP